MEALKKAGTVIISIILWVVILIAALFAFTTLATRDTDHVASLAGFTPLTVQSDSMAPTFCKGDLIIIQATDPSTLQEGDVITFHAIIDNEYALNTHRIDKITTDNGVRSYVTKGDNNEVSDTHVISDGDIVGKQVVVLPGIGNLMEFLSSSLGFLVIIVLPMLLFFVFQVYRLITISINYKRALEEEAREEKAGKILDAEEAQKGASDDTQHNLDEASRIKEEAEAQLAEARRMKEEAEALKRSLAEEKE